MVLFQNLTGSSSANRRRALLDLGWKEEAESAEDPNVIGDGRFYRVNLDDDPEMEAILTLKTGSDRARIVILKKSGGQWWQVGRFYLTDIWTASDAQLMLEIRNIVDFDSKEILIREKGKGSDIQKEIELAVYRLYAGRLYRTFQITEEFALRRYSEAGVDTIEDERNEIFYPEPVQGQGAYLVVNRSEQNIPWSDWGVIDRPRNVVGCIPYRWDPIKYLFVADRSASSKFCRK